MLHAAIRVTATPNSLVLTTEEVLQEFVDLFKGYTRVGRFYKGS